VVVAVVVAVVVVVVVVVAVAVAVAVVVVVVVAVAVAVAVAVVVRGRERGERSWPCEGTSVASGCGRGWCRSRSPRRGAVAGAITVDHGHEDDRSRHRTPRLDERLSHGRPGCSENVSSFASLVAGARTRGQELGA
jgi:hypothetical protein